MLNFNSNLICKKIRKTMQNMLLGILFCVIVLCGVVNIAYAIGSSPSIVKSGDLDDFAKNAPITTVRLDGSKFTKDNAILTYQMNNKYSSNKFEWGTTSIGERNCVVINDLTTENTLNGDDGAILPGSFTLTFKDAAIMRDGTTKDFSATYTPEILMQQNTESYTDSFTIVAFQSRKSGISVQPLSKSKIHFGLRVYITCQVVGDNTDNLNGETFLLVSGEINSVRPEGTGFSNIVWASDNNNYSEAIKFESGIDGESNLYLPYESTLNTDPSETTGANGYDVRFIASGAPWNSLNHIATVASASGIRAKIWSSAGTNVSPLDTYYLDVSDFTKEHTSSSGEGGKIELWTDGQTHNTDSEANNFRKLAGGTINTPYTYAVPYGKEVTYRMTPNDGYMLDKLYVNGSETDPTNIVYKPDSTEIAYYEYHFDSDTVNEGQEISVTWKKYAATTDPIPVRKVLKGDVPSDAQEFTFTLERKTGPDGNLEQTSNKIVETIKLTIDNGTTVAESEFHGITFKKPGEYIYTVREMKGDAKGYTYDDKVYNIKFLVEPDENDSEILRCTKQIILDGENEVSACEFVNNYEIMNMNDDDIKISETDKGTDESVVPPDTGDNLYTWILYYVLSVILVSLFVFGFFNKNRYKKGSHQK